MVITETPRFGIWTDSGSWTQGVGKGTSEGLVCIESDAFEMS